jgi:type VI secretion system protein ImpH
MKELDAVAQEPYQHSFFRLMRYMERNSAAKPRIGDSITVSDDIAVISQEPYTAFPSSNVSALDRTPRGIPRVHVKFLGMFGPHGALPLHVTETAHIWGLRDPSFRHFVDVFSTRFLQLFYRAWADARPAGQFERPKQDRFQVYLGTFAGIGSPALRDTDDTTQVERIAYSGLVNSYVKSARRLEQLLRGIIKVDLKIIEWIGVWLALDRKDMTALGRNSATLGRDCIVGSQVYSISERFRVRIRCKDLVEYESLLPGSARAEKLARLVFFYIGYHKEFDIELGLKRALVPSLQLGKAGRLGLTAWVPSQSADGGDTYVYDARYDPFGRQMTAAN